MAVTRKVRALTGEGDVIGAMATYYDPGKYLTYYVCFYDSDGADGTTGWKEDHVLGGDIAFGMMDYPPIRPGAEGLPEGFPEPPSVEEVLGE